MKTGRSVTQSAKYLATRRSTIVSNILALLTIPIFVSSKTSMLSLRQCAHLLFFSREDSNNLEPAPAVVCVFKGFLIKTSFN